MKKGMDKEYSTQFLKEVEYLKENGINYIFVKSIGDNVSSYKYEKTETLFLCLSKFYSK